MLVYIQVTMASSSSSAASYFNKENTLKIFPQFTYTVRNSFHFDNVRSNKTRGCLFHLSQGKQCCEFLGCREKTVLLRKPPISIFFFLLFRKYLHINMQSVKYLSGHIYNIIELGLFSDTF